MVDVVKKIRKPVAPPTKVFKDKSKYNRKRKSTEEKEETNPTS